jgi:hypothetical protein
VPPTVSEAFAGVTASETSSGALTVSVVEPLILPGGGGGGGRLIALGAAPAAPAPAQAKVAVIVVLPGKTLLASPAALIVATASADELQVTEVVRFWVLPLLK